MVAFSTGQRWWPANRREVHSPEVWRWDQVLAHGFCQHHGQWPHYSGLCLWTDMAILCWCGSGGGTSWQTGRWHLYDGRGQCHSWWCWAVKVACNEFLQLYKCTSVFSYISVLIIPCVATATDHCMFPWLQIYTVDLDNPEDCGRKFRSNRNLGLMFWATIVAANLLKRAEKDTESEELTTIAVKS